MLLSARFRHSLQPFHREFPIAHASCRLRPAALPEACRLIDLRFTVQGVMQARPAG